MKRVSWNCTTPVIFFDAPVSRMVVQLHPICRPPFLVRSPREHCFGFFNIFEYLQHLCPEMFATRITQLPKISVSSVRRLDLLGMRMEEDELPQPRSDAST